MDGAPTVVKGMNTRRLSAPNRSLSALLALAMVAMTFLLPKLVSCAARATPGRGHRRAIAHSGRGVRVFGTIEPISAAVV